MKYLCIFFLAFTVLSVSCIPSRQRRQFDWAEWENNGNSDWSGNRPTRQWNSRNRGGNFNQGNGRQLPPNGWNQGQGQNWNQGNQGNQVTDFDIDQLFNQNPNNQIPDAQVPNNQLPVDVSTTTQGTTTTTASANYRRCYDNCQSTREYNPVCGTDGNTYHNLQRLMCASQCGGNVQLLRGGTCQPL